MRLARRTRPAPRARHRPQPAPPAGAEGLRAALRPPSRGPVRAAAARVLAAAEAVHQVPLILPAVPVRGTANRVRVGGYRYIDTARAGAAPALRACDITVSRGAAALSLHLAHEVGHMLDHVGIGHPDRFASTDRDPLLDEVLRAITRTGAYAALGAVPSRSRRRYLRDRRELFARAYAQYLAVRSGDADLRALVTAAASRDGAPPAEQWDDDDFAPVAAALDALMHRLGWAGAGGGRIGTR